MLKIFLCSLLLLLSQIMHAEEADITMLFVGDVMLAEKPGQLIAQGRDPFRYVQSFFRAADIRIGNLECAVSHKGKAEDKTYTFRAHPRVIGTLKKYFDAVSVANNHAGDFGPIAFEDMLYQLEKKQLAYFGGGRTLRAAHEPYLTTVKGKKIAVLGYDGFFPRSFEALEDRAGVAWLDEDFIVADIKRAREVHHADWVIVFPHWGWEYEKLASSQQQKLAHLMIDSGADAVVGGHPHVTQNIEIYKNKPIFYSLGNFVFNGFHDEETTTGWIAVLTLKSQSEVKWKIIPVRLDQDGVPRPIANK
jgi:poly-gamma-glutamate capsule biosynthesis protein CapA/YwtB (metallophosphatase superfamily)